MDERPRVVSPYHRFSRAQWAALRADTPLTLGLDDLARLQSINEPITLEDVIAIYLPLSRLLALYVAAAQGLFKATQRFLGADAGKVPYIIGVAGSVAAGKSTFCRIMRALLARWPNTPRVELVTTDGFLLPNAVLEAEGLMGRKGFPESYDGAALLRFISDVKAGRRAVEAPVYSHLTYDIVADERVSIDRPDILIVEGLNVLQQARRSREAAREGGDGRVAEGRVASSISDFFDFSIYLHADDDDLERWYVERFLRLRETSFRDPRSYFRKYADLDGAAAEVRAREIWRDINYANLVENVAPTRARANLILTKGESHRIEGVELRKL